MVAKVNLSVSDKIWIEYRKMCIDKSNHPSHRVEEFMREELKKHGIDVDGIHKIYDGITIELVD